MEQHFFNRFGIECKIIKRTNNNIYYCHYLPNFENRKSTGIMAVNYYEKCKKLKLIREI